MPYNIIYMKGRNANMGRQIRFFFDKEDEIVFLNHVYEKNYSILDTKATILGKTDAIESEELQFKIADNSSTIVIKDNGYVDDFKSDVIVYSRCKVWKDGDLAQGRIWAEFRYWISSDEIAVKSDEFTKMYNGLARWIKKNSRISINKAWYIGAHAYEQYLQGTLKMDSGSKDRITDIPYYIEF
jgi:hypothetical protein